MTEVFIMAASQSRRDALTRRLAGATSIHVAGTAGTFAFLRSLIDQSLGDVAVIDTDVGAGLTREWLLDIVEHLPVVILMPLPDAIVFNTILRSERASLLRSDASAEQIIQAIDSLHLGLLTLDARLVPEHEDATDLAEDLTPREREVLTLLAEGLGNRDIAAQLNISEHTIKF